MMMDTGEPRPEARPSWAPAAYAYVACSLVRCLSDEWCVWCEKNRNEVIRRLKKSIKTPGLRDQEGISCQVRILNLNVLYGLLKFYSKNTPITAKRCKCDITELTVECRPCQRITDLSDWSRWSRLMPLLSVSYRSYKWDTSSTSNPNSTQFWVSFHLALFRKIGFYRNLNCRGNCF